MVPYNPVFLLDLVSLAYQLHSQALFWPMDPYAEQVTSLLEDKKERENLRKKFLKEAKTHFKVENNNSQVKYRGPADLLNGNPAGNRNLDTVLQNYTKIDPRKLGLSRQNTDFEGLVAYATPESITNRIKEVWMVSKEPFKPADQSDKWASDQSVIAQRLTLYDAPLGSDLLYCIEGVTGKHKPKAVGSRGVLGHVLARKSDDGDYDIFIVFRGTRSGRLRTKTMGTNSGHPDYVTNFSVSEDKTVTGKVFNGVQNYRPITGKKNRTHIGYALAIEEMLPAISHAVKLITATMGAKLRSVYVTGHSLGGGLAGVMTLALRVGESQHAQDLRRSFADHHKNTSDSIYQHRNPIFSSAYFVTDGEKLNNFYKGLTRITGVGKAPKYEDEEAYKHELFLPLYEYYVAGDVLKHKFQNKSGSIAKWMGNLTEVEARTPLEFPDDFELENDKGGESAHSPQTIRPALIAKLKRDAEELKQNAKEGEADTGKYLPADYMDTPANPFMAFSKSIRAFNGSPDSGDDTGVLKDFDEFADFAGEELLRHIRVEFPDMKPAPALDLALQYCPEFSRKEANDYLTILFKAVGAKTADFDFLNDGFFDLLDLTKRYLKRIDADDRLSPEVKKQVSETTAFKGIIAVLATSLKKKSYVNESPFEDALASWIVLIALQEQVVADAQNP